MEVTSADFGVTGAGERARKYELTNGRMRVVVTDLGATVLAVNLPDAGGAGGYTNVAPCHQTIEKLEPNDLGANPKMGTTCGRVCNRTAKARFVLDGVTYPLAVNDGENHLHGGVRSFDRKVWSLAGTKVTPDAAAVTFELLSPDGDEGYPGAVLAGCTISLTRDNNLGIQYTGECKDGKSTVFSLTNHCYWNLSGLKPGSSIEDHVLTLQSDEFVPVDPATFIPTGGLAPVDDASMRFSAPADQPTPIDFRAPSRIGDKLQQISGGDKTKGYNLSFVVRGWPAEGEGGEAASAPAAAVHDAATLARVLPAGTLSDPATGRRLEISTSSPCIHFYSCFAWDARFDCEGAPLAPASALALECQFPTDSANRGFGRIPSCILRPGERYSHLTLHKFSWPGSEAGK